MKDWTLRPFTKDDWNGLAGASPLERDGEVEEPWLGYVEPEGVHAGVFITVVVDAEGASVEFHDAEGEQLAWVTLPLDLRDDDAFGSIEELGRYVEALVKVFVTSAERFEQWEPALRQLRRVTHGLANVHIIRRGGEPVLPML